MNISIDVLSIVYIVILAICLIIGLSKGLIKSIFSIAGWIIALILSGLFDKDVTKLLMGTGMANSIKADLVAKFNSQNPLFTEKYKDNFETFANSKNLPDFIRNSVRSMMDMLSAGGEGTISEVLSTTIVYYIFVVVTFVLLFVVFLILFKVIGALVSKIEDGSKAFKVVNRTLGAVVYVCLGLAIIGVANYIFAICTITGGEFGNWLTETMKLGPDTPWTFSKFLYEHNYLGEVISGLIDILF